MITIVADAICPDGIRRRVLKHSIVDTRFVCVGSVNVYGTVKDVSDDMIPNYVFTPLPDDQDRHLIMTVEQKLEEA